ncbi:hypothetical protein StoSoilB5_30590 [Arthrobacter sp. StoSoilB5]|nr:hypothetical protein StoSoilB5_30590 [Arthrobacter sp. StoSoilB5]
MRAAQWSAGTIQHAGFPELDIASRPAGRGRHGDIESFGGAAQRQVSIHHAPGEFQTTGRGKDRVRVGHEDLLDCVTALDKHHTTPGGPLIASHQSRVTNLPGHYI